MDDDHCEVGGTGREGFSEGPLSGNFDDGDNYENIGGDDDQRQQASLNMEMTRQAIWLKEVSEQDTERRAEYSQQK